MIRVDLRVDLLNHTIPSLRLLGEALNRQDRAEAFISLYQSHMDRIHQRIAAYQGPHPGVLLQLHLGRGDECCTTTLKGNLGQLLEFAGGNNIAAAQVKGYSASLAKSMCWPVHQRFILLPAWQRLAAKPKRWRSAHRSAPRKRRRVSVALSPRKANCSTFLRFKMVTLGVVAQLLFKPAACSGGGFSLKRFIHTCLPTFHHRIRCKLFTNSFAAGFHRNFLEPFG